MNGVLLKETAMAAVKLDRGNKRDDPDESGIQEQLDVLLLTLSACGC